MRSPESGEQVERLRVGNFDLYPSERQLCVDGKPVELGARAFDLLLTLAGNAGRLVTKADLLDRVWPGLVVDENNLAAQVANLRRVLGAGAIRTVPRFGYRLDLEVRPAGIEATQPSQQVPAASSAALRLDVPRRGWPTRLGPLVGRDADLRELEQALEDSFLVTVVGPAGIGKTRLAQEVLLRRADQAGQAVAWVALAPLRQAEELAPAIAVALGLSLPEGQQGIASLRQALERVSLLLILDNAEHLADTLAPMLVGLVTQTAGLRMLVTSQVPLGAPEESVFRLSGLPLAEPGTLASGAGAGTAAELFAARAAQADRDFALSAANAAEVAEICRRLDGNPLALELAATRVASLGLQLLLQRLDDRFRLLRPAGRPGDPRHDVLEAAFDWSYGLLTPAEQRVFDRLAVFPGSFTLQSAAACVADADIDTTQAIDLLGRLVDRSLVAVLADDPPRYRLSETARCYAQKQLAQGVELSATRARMARVMRELLDRAYEDYWTTDEALWLHQYAPELDNLRAALDWATEQDGPLAVELYGSAWPLLVELDLQAEGRARYQDLVALLPGQLPPLRRGRFWEALATFDSSQQFDRARYAAELAAGLHAEAGHPRAQYYALSLLVLNSRDDDAAARAASAAAQALVDPGWPPRLLATGAMAEGAMLTSAGQYDGARNAYRRAMNLALTMSERQALAATVHVVEVDIACGDTGAALQLARPLALSLRHSGRRETQFELLVMLFSALLLAGQDSEARSTAAELCDLAQRLDPERLCLVLDAMACLACRDGRHDNAARILVASDRMHETHGQRRRRPAEERLRAAVSGALDAEVGKDWLQRAEAGYRPLTASAACALALGLDATG